MIPTSWDILFMEKANMQLIKTNNFILTTNNGSTKKESSNRNVDNDHLIYPEEME